VNKAGIFSGMGVLLAATAFGQVELMELPASSRGINIGQVHASLFGDLLYFYDSNVDFVNDDPTSDSGIQAKAGVDLSYGRNEHNLFVRGWYMVERHMDETRVDRDQWSVQSGYTFESPNGTALRLDEIYEQVYENDLETGRWQDRREFRASASLGRQVTEKTSVVFGGKVSDITYEQAGLYDWREYAVDVDLGQRLTAKSSVIVNLAYSEQTSESVSRNSSSVGVSAGFSSRPTSKVTYRATAGVESYDSGVDGEKKLGATYRLAMDWKVSEKWTATLAGAGQYQPGEDVARNYAQVFTLGTGVTYRPTRRLTTTLQALYRRDDFEQPVRTRTGPTIYIPINGPYQTWLVPFTIGSRWGGEQRTDDQVTLRADVSFKLNKYTSLSAGGEYGLRASTIESQYGYDRYRVHTGLNLRY